MTVRGEGAGWEGASERGNCWWPGRESPCSADWPRIVNGKVRHPPLVSVIMGHFTGFRTSSH